jgi:hypothetical protein
VRGYSSSALNKTWWLISTLCRKAWEKNVYEWHQTRLYYLLNRKEILYKIKVLKLINEEEVLMTSQKTNETNFDVNEVTALAKIFYDSKIFDVTSVSQVVVKILAGREMGLSPIQSMSSVYILDNKVGYEVKVLLGVLKKSGRYDYTSTFLYDDKGILHTCIVKFYKTGQDDKRVALGESTFSLVDVAKLGLQDKSYYQNYPDLMLFYRAASKGIKMFCPDVLDGAAMYEDYIELLPDVQNKTLKDKETIAKIYENKVPISVTNGEVKIG